MNKSIENGHIPSQTTMRERLERFGLLMRRMALDRTLSRRYKEDFGAPPKHWSSTPEMDESEISI